MAWINRKCVKGLAGSALVLSLLAGAPDARANELSVTPSRDNSMYSEGGDLSNGIGEYLFVGDTLVGSTRRALLAFDLSGIPAGSTITAVNLTLSVSQARRGAGNVTIATHRAIGSWGEGNSDAGVPGGGGVGAAAGDTTWTMRVFPGTPWNTAGGDFVAAESGNGVAGESGTFVIASTPQMVADVQGWIDGTIVNDGWFLVSPPDTGNARRLDSRESVTPALRPSLVVTYTPPAATCPADLDNGSGTGTPDGGVDINDLLYFLAQFEAGSASVDLDNGSGTGTPDGGVDINDLLYFLSHFETGC